eukprot:jgi/Mesvir1/19711/Mv09971-RA.1
MDWMDPLTRSTAWDNVATLAIVAGVLIIALVILRAIFSDSIPRIEVPPPQALAPGKSPRKVTRDEADLSLAASCGATTIVCYDPSNMDFLGHAPAMTRDQVIARVAAARRAYESWRHSSFHARRRLLRVMMQYIVENQELICRVASKDSGKPLVDAAFGEVMVTCEKIAWLLAEGERHLRPEYRSASAMMMYKSARVEYHPLGVLGAIVPWNYPFHNLFNPLLAAVFAGNAIVIKMSEYASWSALFFEQVIRAALRAGGAPEDLVQIITGYGEAGEALVTAAIDKLTFVGSTNVGKKVMAKAAERLTPVVLELGGKDAIIVCDDADLSQLVPIALRGAFQSAGQNCAGAERFYVHERVYDAFVDKVVATARQLRQGDPGARLVDCGSLCMPRHAAYVQSLVDDAVAKGATAVVGGSLASVPAGTEGQFYPPTVLVGVTHSMRITQEEVFGPVLVVIRVGSDHEAVTLANDCPFGLGSSVFSADRARANRIASQLRAGMSSINDFATTYMCQSLPFGGVKDSGFDRFAGIEGLRGCCVAKAVVEDRLPFIKTTIPPPLQYPVKESAFAFVSSLIRMFYGVGLGAKAHGLAALLKCLVMPGAKQAAPKQQ